MLPLVARAPAEQQYTRPPRVMASDEGWKLICEGLIMSGICGLLRERDVYHLSGKPVLNGMFGVTKNEYSNGVETYRLIMNLIPINKLCRSITGDVSTLPSWAGMQALVLEDGELLLTSSEDVRCFFYLFRIPADWHKYMCFNKAVPRELLPHTAPEENHYLCSLVLPMGFLNSVGIAQHIHRRIAQQAVSQEPPGLGGECELRKDRTLPISRDMYRVYLDNFDLLKQVEPQGAALLQGEVDPAVSRLRERYLALGVPRHPKKSVSNQLQADVQGALVNGQTGRVYPKPSKVLQYLWLGILLLDEGRANQRQLQVLGGGFVYMAMFRRGLLGSLNRIWQEIIQLDNEPPAKKIYLSPELTAEIARFVGFGGLAQMDLRACHTGMVTASDASSTGGGITSSVRLTPYGATCSRGEVRGEVYSHHEYIEVLTLSLFDGLAALRVAADVIGLPVSGHISCDTTEHGTRVVESYFPNSIFVDEVTTIDSEMVKCWSAQFSMVGVVIIGACQGVSWPHSERPGTLQDRRAG